MPVAVPAKKRGGSALKPKSKKTKRVFDKFEYYYDAPEADFNRTNVIREVFGDKPLLHRREFLEIDEDRVPWYFRLDVAPGAENL